MKILGLGFASLITACKYPDAKIIVPQSQLDQFDASNKHLGVLRFKTDRVAKMTQIAMNYTDVYKGIYSDAQGFISPNIAASNAYSLHTTGVISKRSIWDANGVCKRYIPPVDFTLQLQKKVSNLFQLGEYTLKNLTGEPVISTVPLWVWYPNILKKAVEYTKPIRVAVFKVPLQVNVEQTVYLPYHDYLYRATLTSNNTLIAECYDETALNGYNEMYSCYKYLLHDVFGFGDTIKNYKHFELIADQTYKMGKLKTGLISEAERKAMIYNLTRDYNMYSLGRYATLRNIGLDDICDDLEKIDHILNIDAYSLKMHQLETMVI